MQTRYHHELSLGSKVSPLPGLALTPKSLIL